MSDVGMTPRTGDVERIPVCDLDDARSRLEVVRHIAAMVNSGGGSILVGARRNGSVLGVTPEAVAKLAGHNLADIVAGYLRPDRADLTVEVIDHGASGQLVGIAVGGHPEPPVVLAQAGTYHDAKGEAHQVFAASSVMVRRSGRSEPAQRSDYVRWRTEAIDDQRRELHERLLLVVEAPPGSRVRVITDDDVRDEPSYFLARSTELFRVQSEQLLTSSDLVYLWLHRRTLDLDGDTIRLLVHSALRKRATLYLWLAVMPVTADQVRQFLFEAVTMSDRDKSDAARAVLLLCALYLDAETYDALARELRASTYAHMREAVEVLPDIDQARAQIKGEQNISGSQKDLLSAPDHELLAQVDQLLAQEGPPSRRVPSFGLELLSRKLARGQSDGDSSADD